MRGGGGGVFNIRVEWSVIQAFFKGEECSLLIKIWSYHFIT